MDKLKIRGMKNIDGMKFHDIEGGFGKDRKAMLVKEIADIHNRDLKDINRNINNNVKRFKYGVDILDLKVGESKSLSLELGYSNQSYANANNIYLLSERGYSKLLKILEDDVAWEQYEKLVDGYFNMRSEIPKMSKELQAIFMIDEKAEELKIEINGVKDDVNNIKNNLPLLGVDCEEITKKVKSVATKVLGGYKSYAYVNKSIRKKVYSDIYHQLKREFEVSSYKAIKRCQLEIALEIILDYRVPTALREEIVQANAQIRLQEII